eukprot:gene23438-biopygen8863
MLRDMLFWEQQPPLVRLPVWIRTVGSLGKNIRAGSAGPKLACKRCDVHMRRNGLEEGATLVWPPVLSPTIRLHPGRDREGGRWERGTQVGHWAGERRPGRGHPTPQSWTF